MKARGHVIMIEQIEEKSENLKLGVYIIQTNSDIFRAVYRLWKILFIHPFFSQYS